MQEYFDRNAHAWVEAAYAGDVRFPVGAERVRLAIEGVAPAMRDGARLVDLGCGGGQLCVHAANLGWRAVGVDSAPGMIEYLPNDDGLFGEAARLLRPGGRFAVSCRNRLYNLQSVNEYTAKEPETARLLMEGVVRSAAGRPAQKVTISSLRSG